MTDEAKTTLPPDWHCARCDLPPANCGCLAGPRTPDPIADPADMVRQTTAEWPPADGLNINATEVRERMREWLVIEDSRKNAVFATTEMQHPKGYIPREAAEALLGRDLGGPCWFTAEDSARMRAHPEWRTSEP